MMSLEKTLIKIMESAVHVGEYDQRSALGIADSYVRGSQVDTDKAKFDDNEVPVNRDALALAMIEALGETDRPACKDALQGARRKLNAPYAEDPKMLAWRAQRAGKGALGTMTGEK